MAYQVKLETVIGELEDYGPAFTNKAKAISFARRAARTTIMPDVTRFHVDANDQGIFAVEVRK